MKSNRSRVILFLAIILAFMLVSCNTIADETDISNVTNKTDLNTNDNQPTEYHDEEIYIFTETKLERKDGLDDPEIAEYYKDDIQEIYDIAEYPHIDIDCYDVDLNNDGFIDKLIFFEASGYCGSAGCSFEILLNDGDSGFMRICNATARFHSSGTDPDPPLEFYVSEETTNGFNNIIIKCLDDKITELAYDGEKYRFIFWNSDYREPVIWG